MPLANPGLAAGNSGMLIGTNKSGAKDISPQILELWFFLQGFLWSLESSQSFFAHLFLRQRLF